MSDERARAAESRLRELVDAAVQRADLAALRAERDAAKASLSAWMAMAHEATEEAATLRARVEALKGALRPFADTCVWVERHWKHTKPHTGYALMEVPVEEQHFDMRDLLDARAALEPKP